MTRQQEQDRLDRINKISNEIRDLMHCYSFEIDKAQCHLERAKAHLDEAWIDADGQNARTVEKLVSDIDSYHKLFSEVIAAKPGTEFKISGKTFVKGGAS